MREFGFAGESGFRPASGVRPRQGVEVYHVIFPKKKPPEGGGVVGTILFERVGYLMPPAQIASTTEMAAIAISTQGMCG